MEILGPLATGSRVGEGDEALPPGFSVGLRAADKLKHWIGGYVWRETHWMWLLDSLAAGKVVQTAWGDADEWLKFGTHDAHSVAPLRPDLPRYLWTDHFGMRWEIFGAQLKELFRRRNAREYLQVVEVGVFAGLLSHHLLEEHSYIQLIGVDPYIGRDGTFPGNFSDTLDSEVAMYKASTVFDPHKERAQLWPVTSEVAAGNIENGTLDAVFIDGCHLYECVKQDLELWIPKLKRGVEVLVAGHDFSPQWPGVVRAVHEERGGGRDVYLATDWMYWWWEQY